MINDVGGGLAYIGVRCRTNATRSQGGSLVSPGDLRRRGCRAAVRRPRLIEGGRRIAMTYSLVDLHGATMAATAIASLAALVGLFTVLESRDGDRRAAPAGLRPGALLSARLIVLVSSALTATAVALTTTALTFDAVNWPIYAAANVLIALTYGLIGALIAPIFGRVGGVFVAFLLPFLDIGIVQNPMLALNPPPGPSCYPATEASASCSMAP